METVLLFTLLLIVVVLVFAQLHHANKLDDLHTRVNDIDRDLDSSIDAAMERHPAGSTRVDIPLDKTSGFAKDDVEIILRRLQEGDDRRDLG